MIAAAVNCFVMDPISKWVRHLDGAPSASSFEASYAIDTTRLTPQEVAASILATIRKNRA